MRHRRRNRIADLAPDIPTRALKHVVVRKALNPCCLSGSQWPILQRVAIATSGEAVESAGDGWAQAIPFQPAEHIRPATFFRIHPLMAWQAESNWNIPPTTALRNVGKAENIQVGDPSPLMVREHWMGGVIRLRLGQAFERVANGSTSRNDAGGQRKSSIHIVPAADHEKSFPRLRKSEVRRINKSGGNLIITESVMHHLQVLLASLLPKIATFSKKKKRGINS